MLYVPSAADFQTVLYGPAAVRPAAAIGATVTPGNNTKGSYAQLISGASLTQDVYGIWINFNSNFLATATRSTICDIGIDPAGGTTYTILIADLLASCASSFCADREGHGGINYYFPLFIKSGSSIGCAASVNNATVGTLRCQARFYCKPKHPESIKVGSFVQSLGVTTNSKGTVVTSGTTAEGAWTSLGSTTKPTWYAQAGFSIDVLIASNLGYYIDLSAGVAGGEKLLEDDTVVTTNNTDDSMGKYLAIPLGGEVPSSTTIWGRSQCSGTGETASMMAYLVGG